MSKQTWTQYELDTTYEITINFDDEWQYVRGKKNYGLNRITNFNTFIETTFIKEIELTGVKDYTFYTELSDPQVIQSTGGQSKMPRLHLHGTITTPNEYEDLLIFKLTLSNIGKYGRVQINKYRPEYWQEYIKKDYKKYKKWLKKWKPKKMETKPVEETEMLMVNYV